ncbi:potassium/sodium hyperpolarization-activated cyclic nucleotide-gated channel 2-like [Xylocopa sonorina]|uniref:potassium/sodium hyperpolarization-activated cyclic nucleotide-gated channel 2-like n=1 Tax=Xylocopa sonorina TaxID=1818115 RepID=UPI00403B1891
MYQVKEYIRDKKLPENLKNKLITYYEYRFQGSYFKENAISGTLSNHLNQEILIHSSRGLLETATILHFLPRYVIGNLMGVLKPVIYLNKDIIYKSETQGDCMFFIVSGTVALITFNGKESICHEEDGGYFGEAALIFPDRRRLESVIALEVCELLCLNRRDFKRMFPSSSTFYKRLENVAKERYEHINELINITIIINIRQLFTSIDFYPFLSNYIPFHSILHLKKYSRATGAISQQSAQTGRTSNAETTRRLVSPFLTEMAPVALFARKNLKNDWKLQNQL